MPIYESTIRCKLIYKNFSTQICKKKNMHIIVYSHNMYT
jgi:hypothetical protein